MRCPPIKRASIVVDVLMSAGTCGQQYNQQQYTRACSRKYKINIFLQIAILVFWTALNVHSNPLQSLEKLGIA